MSMTELPVSTLGAPSGEAVEPGSRDLLARVLQGMSSHIAGGATMDFTDTSALITPIKEIDEPEPDAPNEAFTEDGADQAAPPPAKTGGNAWGGYENGKIPTKALKAIGQGSHKLEATAADAWIAMREAAKAAGVTLSLTDSYRSYDQQVAVRKAKGHLVATATPGTSVHGWGKAVDANVKDPKALAWLRANAGRFGWVNPKWAQTKGKNHEPWHWEFVGGGS